MKKRKSWVRNKNTVLHCGNCEWCNKDLLSNEGGWIITASKKYFCHDGKDGSCFDQYCHVQLDKQKEKNAIYKV